MSSRMNDDGLMFLASVRKTTSEMLHRETPNRLEFLAWIDAHYQAGDDLTVTTEARGPAAHSMLSAIRFGAARMRTER